MPNTRATFFQFQLGFITRPLVYSTGARLNLVQILHGWGSIASLGIQRHRDEPLLAYRARRGLAPHCAWHHQHLSMPSITETRNGLMPTPVIGRSTTPNRMLFTLTSQRTSPTPECFFRLPQLLEPGRKHPGGACLRHVCRSACQSYRPGKLCSARQLEETHSPRAPRPSWLVRGH